VGVVHEDKEYVGPRCPLGQIPENVPLDLAAARERHETVLKLLEDGAILEAPIEGDRAAPILELGAR
jgi:hypothetical protein